MKFLTEEEYPVLAKIWDNEEDDVFDRIGTSWTSEPDRHWFKRCDKCGTWRLWGNYYDVYGDYGKGEEIRIVFWYECEPCLIQTISKYADED